MCVMLLRRFRMHTLLYLTNGESLPLLKHLFLRSFHNAATTQRVFHAANVPLSFGMQKKKTDECRNLFGIPRNQTIMI